MIKFIILTIAFFVLVMIPRVAKAEIATVRDWIGVFPLSNANSKNNTVESSAYPDGHAWVYTSSCTQTPGTIPKLTDVTGCSFTFDPFPPDGPYQFRMYANDQETADALIGTSKTFLSGPATPPTNNPPTTDKLYQINGNLDINSNITANVTSLIFVTGNLNINANLINANHNTGIVFVVKGDVVIAPSVIQIDAILVSSGNIYTAGADCNINSVTTSPLVINGSLININPYKQILFCRTLLLDNDTTPAEKINQQPKYLVILRNLYSETLQKWSEIP